MKYLKIIIIIILGFTFSSCGKNDNIAVIENVEYNLNKVEENNKVKYKIAENFRKLSDSNEIVYLSENGDDKPYFIIKLSYYENSSLEFAINDSAKSYDDTFEANFNNESYNAVHLLNDENYDVNIYYHEHNNNIYVFEFYSRTEISKLIKPFLSNVSYN